MRDEITRSEVIGEGALGLETIARATLGQFHTVYKGARFPSEGDRCAFSS